MTKKKSRLNLALALLVAPVVVVSSGAAAQSSRTIKTKTRTTETQRPTKKADYNVNGDGSGDESSVQPTDETVVKQTETTTEVTTEIRPEPTLGEKSKETARRMSKSVEGAVGQAGNRREDSRFNVMVDYSPLDLILPSKIGGSLGYVDSSAYTYELEYLSASLAPPKFIEDVGGFTDRRVSLMVRSYSDRNSFNFVYGLTYFDMQIHVGSKYLQSSSGRPANLDLLASRSIGLIMGVGNRWVLPYGFTLGIDWITWSQPVFIVEKNSDLLQYIQNQSDRDVLDSLLSTIGYFPRFTLLKLGIGYTF